MFLVSWSVRLGAVDASGLFYPSCPSHYPPRALPYPSSSQPWGPCGREWKANWELKWVCNVTPQQGPWPTTPPPPTPSLVFEEDIYKPLVWQRGEGWLFYLPDLSCATVHEASCADRLTEWRLIGPLQHRPRVVGGGRGPPECLATSLPVGRGEGLMQWDRN